MGLRPAQGDEKYLLFGNHTQWKRRPPPLSSRPERSVVERSAVQRTFPGNVFRQNGREVERSLCGCSLLEMFFDRTSMDLRGHLRR
jgi:hypothetical protein